MNSKSGKTINGLLFVVVALVAGDVEGVVLKELELEFGGWDGRCGD